jgi:L-histidine N-alpha-methyltransferase
VSESALAAAGDALAAEYPGLAVHAVVADFEKYLGVPSDAGSGPAGNDGGGPRLVAFLGSTSARCSCAGCEPSCALVTRSCSAPTW